MKIFQKLILLLLLLTAGVYGASTWFFASALYSLKSEHARNSAMLLAQRLRHQLETNRTAMSNERQRTVIENVARNDVGFARLENLWVLEDGQRPAFALRTGPAASSPDFTLKPAAAKIDLQRQVGGDSYIACWKVTPASGQWIQARILAPESLDSLQHNLALKLYMIGLGGIVGVVLVGFVGSRVLRAPIRRIDEAMTNIVNRRYGFRLKGRPSDEFSGTYEKVNKALTRLEQLDSVQRTAVRRKNTLLNELKTISRFLDIMAHEIKNPLHALALNLDVLKTKIQRSKIRLDAGKQIKILEKEMEHLQEVVQGFLRYFRPGVPQKERVEVNRLIKDVCEMAGGEAEKNLVKLETRLGKGLSEIFVDRGQFQQALHNIILNGIHASAKNTKLFVRSWSKGKRVLVSVRDEGSGMSREELRQVFDLYFTTKKNGSGIGLPISKRMVEANGGELEVESKSGKGTTVTFLWNAV